MCWCHTQIINYLLLIGLNEAYSHESGGVVVKTTALTVLRDINAAGANSTQLNNTLHSDVTLDIVEAVLRMTAVVHVMCATLKFVGHYMQYPLMSYFLEVGYAYGETAKKKTEKGNEGRKKETLAKLSVKAKAAKAVKAVKAKLSKPASMIINKEFEYNIFILLYLIMSWCGAGPAAEPSPLCCAAR